MKVQRAELLLQFVDGSTKAWGWELPDVKVTLGTNYDLSGGAKSDLRAEIFGPAYPLQVVETVEIAGELDATEVVEGELVDLELEEGGDTDGTKED